MKIAFAGVALMVLFSSTGAQAGCGAPPDPVTHVKLSGHPFSAIPSHDGCTIFVSLPGNGQSRIATLNRSAPTPAREVAVEGEVTGMNLSPDSRFLAAATGSGVAVFDTARLTDGAGDALLTASDDGAHAGSIYTAFTPDGHFLFAANERSASLSVYDARGLPQSLKHIGQIAVGRAPVGLTFSPDGKYLYSTSQVGPETWPLRCTREGPRHPEGLLAVIDVAKATSDPAHAVLAGVAAGCNPVRVALAPGGTLFVTARGDDALEAFDAQKLLIDAPHAQLAKVRVGSSPVGVIAAGGKIVVTNSDRFGGGDHQTLSVLEPANLAAPQASIPAGGFPRELSVTADGALLLATNFASRDIELIDLARLDAAEK